MTTRFLHALALVGQAALLALAGCGGGGDNNGPDPAAQDEAAREEALAKAPSRWRPRATDSWQWQLSGTVNTGYDAKVYDIDLFDAPQATIDVLRSRGRRVVCYFSAGSAEDWRPDHGRFSERDMGRPLDGWNGERWLDTRSANVRRIMAARLDLAKRKGCDGVEPDNVDAYANGSGLALSAASQLDYNRFIARAARARGLAVGLKNDIDQAAELEPEFDFAINEQCFEYDECAGYRAFTLKGKPVFNAEYAADYRSNSRGARDALCRAARAAGLRTLVLAQELDDRYRYSCS